MPSEIPILPAAHIEPSARAIPVGHSDAVTDTAVQQDFEALLKAGNIAPASAVAAPAYEARISTPVSAFGERILDGLDKLGVDLGAFGKVAIDAPAMASPPATKNIADTLREMHGLFKTSMREQARSYSEIFEVELVTNTSEQAMKSLKSLLTQGGG